MQFPRTQARSQQFSLLLAVGAGVLMAGFAVMAISPLTTPAMGAQNSIQSAVLDASTLGL